MSGDSPEADRRVRMVTTHRACHPELRDVIIAKAEELGLDMTHYGGNITILADEVRK